MLVLRMKRADKVRAIKRFLIANTGIPGIREQPRSNELDAPYPYRIRVFTNHSNEPINRYIKHEARRDMIDFGVRFDMDIPSPADALVVMPLSTFTQLIKTHYETHIEGRGE